MNRVLLAVIVSVSAVVPGLAQSGANRTAAVPGPQPTKAAAIAETRSQRDCRLHCASLAATPNGKNLPALNHTAIRTQKCQSEMLGTAH
jgi:hypothetical protein